MGLRRGYDIRKKGSGNAGATNLMILEGKKAGAFVMCFDISKAAVSVGLARKLFAQSKFAGEAAGAACILGHMYPALMRFRGGKGLACLGGVILAFGVNDFLTCAVCRKASCPRHAAALRIQMSPRRRDRHRRCCPWAV